MGCVLTLPIKRVTKLLAKSTKRYQEDKAWEMWLARYQHMNEKNFVSFKDFCNPKEQTDDRPADEILDEVKLLLNNNKGAWAV